MSTNYTQNYKLCQWEPSDKVLRTDFNEDNAKLETALSGLQTSLNQTNSTLSYAYSPSYRPLVAGSYVGTGSASRTIYIGFRPRAVLVISGEFLTADYTGVVKCIYSGMAVDGITFPNEGAVAITSQGFSVSYSIDSQRQVRTNESNRKYLYIAIR